MIVAVFSALARALRGCYRADPLIFVALAAGFIFGGFVSWGQLLFRLLWLLLALGLLATAALGQQIGVGDALARATNAVWSRPLPGPAAWRPTRVSTAQSPLRSAAAPSAADPRAVLERERQEALATLDREHAERLAALEREYTQKHENGDGRRGGSG